MSGSHTKTASQITRKDSDSEYDFLFKSLVIGDSGVGKSNLLGRYFDLGFQENTLATIGVDFKIADLQVDQQRLKVQMWDTAGQERFRTIVSSFFRGAHGVVVVYDVTDTDTFAHVSDWVQEAKQYTSSGGRLTILLIGNKTDLDEKRKVTKEQGEELAEELGAVGFAETSALRDQGVTDAFQTFAEGLLANASRPSGSMGKQGNLKLGKVVRASEGLPSSCSC